MCRDVVPFTDASSLRGLAGDDPAFGEAYGRSPFLGACGAWGARRGDPVVATPVRSDVPILVIVGRFDPFGMLPYAQQAISTLPNSTPGGFPQSPATWSPAPSRSCRTSAWPSP